MSLTHDSATRKPVAPSSTLRAMHVRQVASEAPAQQQVSTFTGTPAAMGTTLDVSRYRRGIVILSGLAAETIKLSANANGIAGGDITVFTTAGVAQAATALVNGTFYIRDLGVDTITVLKSAAVQNPVVTIKVYE